MKIGSLNPHHRRVALLQLAMCVLALFTFFPIPELPAAGLSPSFRLPGDVQDRPAFVVTMWVVAAAQLAFQSWAAWRYLRSPSASRVAFIISSVLALAAYPIGTAIGLYSLWVVLWVPLVPERAKQLADNEVA